MCRPILVRRSPCPGFAGRVHSRTPNCGHKLFSTVRGTRACQHFRDKEVALMASHWRMSFVVVAIAATVFLTGLGAARLWDEDEGKNSVCGQEMLARGDWIVPTFNGDLRTDKPILLY